MFVLLFLALLTVLGVAACIFILRDVEDAASSVSAFVTAFSTAVSTASSSTIFSDGSSSTDTFVGVVSDDGIVDVIVDEDEAGEILLSSFVIGGLSISPGGFICCLF